MHLLGVERMCNIAVVGMVGSILVVGLLELEVALEVNLEEVMCEL